ncbi:MAG: hypothetical protein SPJ75_05110 [Candidatus Onthomorpha sp.]|nr:hypothetical protein [Bacteroidales bacterium]MCI7699867.1 hypothetical protein [Bacteroidales bacterium]MDD7590093.1 hypothetical protein [Bacteroidales bacterium]MDY5825861.1 hypothetical protein [Candidatus Onthomorpha sp.]
MSRIAFWTCLSGAALCRALVALSDFQPTWLRYPYHLAVFVLFLNNHSNSMASLARDITYALPLN